MSKKTQTNFATNFAADESLQNILTIANISAEQVDGDHAEALQECLQYLEYLVSIHCTFVHY